jgi:EpsI family protein
MKRTILPGIVGVLLVTAYGIAEGMWTNRWHDSAELEQAAARLSQVPRVVGDWEGTDRELEARQITVGEITSYVLRRYVHRHTGAEVNVLLVCGRAGPTSLHSPEVCYPGTGWSAAAPPARKSIPADSDADTFWIGQFQKAAPNVEALRIYWAWNGSGEWEAADNPRWRFAHHGALYKLYVIRHLPRADEAGADDPTLDFCKHFLPEVRKALFSQAVEGRDRS